MLPFLAAGTSVVSLLESNNMDILFEQIAAAGPLDWLALLTSLAYVWLAARDNNWCWLFAAVSTAIWAWQSFFEYQLVSDALLQVFYFVMAGVGLWRWRVEPNMAKHREYKNQGLLQDGLPIEVETPTRPILAMRAHEHALVIAGSLFFGLALGYFFANTMQAAATYPDAITTVFSIVTTFLLIARRLENWLYWIVIDAVYVWIYSSTGAILFAVMMIINIGMAVYGYLNWRKELTTRKV